MESLPMNHENPLVGDMEFIVGLPNPEIIDTVSDSSVGTSGECCQPTLSDLASEVLAASNDIHFLHFYAVDCFQGSVGEWDRIHELCGLYYEKLADQYDDLAEFSLQMRADINHPSDAASVMSFPNSTASLSDSAFTYPEVMELLRNHIHAILGMATIIYQRLSDGEQSPDTIGVTNYLGGFCEYWAKEANYKLTRRIGQSFRRKKVLTSKIDRDTGGAWISPDGQIFYVGDDAHATWIVEHDGYVAGQDYDEFSDFTEDYRSEKIGDGWIDVRWLFYDENHTDIFVVYSGNQRTAEKRVQNLFNDLYDTFGDNGVSVSFMDNTGSPSQEFSLSEVISSNFCISSNVKSILRAEGIPLSPRILSEVEELLVNYDLNDITVDDIRRGLESMSIYMSRAGFQKLIRSKKALRSDMTAYEPDEDEEEPSEDLEGEYAHNVGGTDYKIWIESGKFTDIRGHRQEGWLVSYQSVIGDGVSKLSFPFWMDRDTIFESIFDAMDEDYENYGPVESAAGYKGDMTAGTTSDIVESVMRGLNSKYPDLSLILKDAQASGDKILMSLWFYESNSFDQAQLFEFEITR